MFKGWSIGGGDTETVKGLPYTLQLWSQDFPQCRTVDRVTKRNITERLFDRLLALPHQTVIFFHNLEFDIQVCFAPFIEPFYTESAFVLKGTFRGARYAAEILFGKVNKLSLQLHEREYLFLDTFAFFKSSLAELSKRFKLPDKLPKPRKLGQIRYQGKEWERFKAYALRDAEVAAALGVHICDFHERFDVPLSISAPQLAARIFRRKFIPPGERLTGFPRELTDAAVLSYHGGKNGLYCDPGIYRNVRLYDINSAYPYAMTQLPNFNGAKYVYRIDGRRVRTGIVCCSGSVGADRFGVTRGHDFREIHGDFNRVWFTTYELPFIRQVVLPGRLKIWEGVSVEESRERGLSNPLRDFARYFYQLKSSERGSLREFYKIVLNSLYGKFIQSTANGAAPRFKMLKSGKIVELAPEDYVAGGLWNPMIASLITGYVRAMLAKLERENDALHVSTDSIMVRRDLETGLGLGELSLKAEGNALLLRPKLYILWDRENRLESFALHGYHGSLKHFVSMLRSGGRRYVHFRMYKLREAHQSKQKLVALTVGKFFKTINIPGGKFDIPPLTYKTSDGKTVIL